MAMQMGLGPAPPTAEEQPNVSEEEQAAYESFVNNALLLIYDKKSKDSVQQGLAGGDNPVAGLANTAAMVVARVEESAEEGGQELPDGVVLHAGMEILSDLANLAGEAGIHDFTDEEIEAATYQAMDRYREIRGDKIDGEKYAAEFEQLKQADASGELDQQFPELAQRYGQQQPAPQPMPPQGLGG
jgi:hypothetical protein